MTDAIEQLMLRLTQTGGPYALERTVRGNRARLKYVHAPKTLNDIVRKASRRGSSIFIVTKSGEMSYEDVFSRVEVLTQYLLHGASVRPKQRIALAIENGPEWVVAFFAIVAAGCVPVLLSRTNDGGVLRCLRVANPSFLIWHANMEGIGDYASGQPIALASADEGGPAELSVVRLGGGTGIASLPEPRSDLPDNDALISFTSGSTGDPKAVVQSHLGVSSGLMNMMLAGIVAGHSAKRPRSSAPLPSCPLVMTPLSYVAGYTQVLLAALMGGKVALIPNWDTDNVLTFLDTHHVTSLPGISSEATARLLEADRLTNKLRTIRSWSANGTAIHEAYVQAITQRHAEAIIFTGYGLTETNGGICSAPWEIVRENPGLVGRLLPTVNVRITDAARNSVEIGGVGEIWLNGPMLMSGYIEEGDELTGLNEGWFNTGDIGYLSATRDLYLLDRRDAFIEIDGHALALGQIEAFLMSIEGVSESWVSLIDSRGTGRLVIAITLLPSRHVELDGLIDKVVSEFQLHELNPIGWMRDDFPRTVSGKIDRRKLSVLAEQFVRAL